MEPTDQHAYAAPLELESRRLVRRPGWVAGVCAGIAEYLGVSAVFLRVVFVVAALMHGLSVFVYVVLWAIMAQSPVSRQPISQVPEPKRQQKSLLAYAGGAVTMLFSFVSFLNGVTESWDKTAALCVRVGICAQRPVPRVDPQPPPGPAPLPVQPGPGPEAELRNVVYGSSHAESDAFRTRDVSTLYRYYAGEALQLLLGNLQQYSAAGEIAIQRLDGQQVHGIRENGSFAQVDLTETWTTLIYDAASGQCLRMVVNQLTPQTANLARFADGWKITSIAFAQVPQKEPVSCANAP